VFCCLAETGEFESSKDATDKMYLIFNTLLLVLPVLLLLIMCLVAV